MGRRTERSRATQEAINAQREIKNRQQGRVANEQLRASLEQYLGSDAQLSGSLSKVDDRVLPYLSRYNFDDAAARSLGSSHRKGIGTYEALKGNHAAANKLLEQAEAAARQGDYDGAERLRSQADAKLLDPSERGKHGYSNWYPVLNAEQIRSLFTESNPNQDIVAGTRLSSPTAQVVGRYLNRAVDLGDRDSDEYKATREELTGGLREGRELAERAITAERRATEQELRRSGFSRGAGRSIYAEDATTARVGATAAYQSSTLSLQYGAAVAEADKYLSTQFAPQFQANALALSQSYIDTASGVRDSYQGALDRLSIAKADFNRQQSILHQHFSAESAKEKAKSRELSQQIIGAVGGIALTALTGGLLGAVVPGLFGASTALGGFGAGAASAVTGFNPYASVAVGATSKTRGG